MRVFPILILSIVLLLASGCQQKQSLQSPGVIDEESSLPGDLQPSGGEDLANYAGGEVIYVPVYSNVFHLGRNLYPLTATLNIHNIDLDNSILLTRVDYYDTDGKLIRRYLQQSMEVSPLQTVQFVVAEGDTSGGTGANFIVEWISKTQVNSPLVEALMISTRTQQGLSFVTSGRVIKTLDSSNIPSTSQ